MDGPSRNDLISRVQELTRANDGRPPGALAFFRDTRLTKQNLWNVGIRSYGDLCELAGFERNRLAQTADTDHLFESLAMLAEKLGRFPDYTDRQIARHNDPSFPGAQSFRTAQNKNGPLDHQLRDWCSSRPQYAKALAIVERTLSQKPTRVPSKPKKIINGYIYLERYGSTGRLYKIGYSENVARRHSQLAAMFPGNLRLLHVIETDDPRGIEQYWLQRFEAKRVDGKTEIFNLDATDVAAFKSRNYQ